MFHSPALMDGDAKLLMKANEAVVLTDACVRVVLTLIGEEVRNPALIPRTLRFLARRSKDDD